jgi:hypothetical protein
VAEEFSEVVVTDHALERYRQRFDPRGTAEKPAAAARADARAAAWVRKWFRPRNGTSSDLRVSGAIVPAVDDRTPGKLVVITVLPLQWAVASRRAQKCGDRGRSHHGGRRPRECRRFCERRTG